MGQPSEMFVDTEVGRQVVEDLGLKWSEAAAVWRWLRQPPRATVVRVNTVKTSRQEACKKIENYFSETGQSFCVRNHPHLSEVLVIERTGTSHHNQHEVLAADVEVMVDEACGLAVLRGADVFVPGILGIIPNTPLGAKVSVWADLEHVCLRGWSQPYAGRRAFLGNGQLLVNRTDVFRDNKRGVGVRMEERIFPCPSLNEREFDGEVMLQNLPSLIAVAELDPQPGDRVLDMCAAPGGKTTHIATRMMNRGCVVALDKSGPKIKQIAENAARHGLTIIHPFLQDGVQSCSEEHDEDNVRAVCVSCGAGCERVACSGPPPYPPGTFDRVLLDAPCSALGQRPQFSNRMRMKELRSFPRLQKKLFLTAVRHLKPGGVLVYSTCTVARAENEDLAAWATEACPELRPVPLQVPKGETVAVILEDQFAASKNSAHALDKASDSIGTDGKECHMMRFGHPLATDSLEDTISFFCCKFIKVS